VLRLDRFLAAAGDGKSFERLLMLLQGVKAGKDWLSNCPLGHPGFIMRVELVEAPVAWCSAGCPDQAVLSALTERFGKPGSQEAAPSGAPAAVPKDSDRIRPEERMTRNPAPSPAGGLLTIREAAAFLKLHPRTVREFVRSGELEGRVIGGRWRFTRKNLDAFYENAPRTWDFQRKGESEE
jgi:excisionase family DNA binding protein